MSIYVDPSGELIVKAPMDMPDRKIFDFIKSRGDWIADRKAAVMANRFISKNAAVYNTFLYLGVELVPVVSTKIKQIVRQDAALLIPAKIPQEKILNRVQKYLKDRAKEILCERCAFFAGQLKLQPGNITINNNKTRWGVCSSSGDIAINWRVIMLAPKLVDYIIVHEFCHLLEFNHTKNFWAIVGTILPNWKALRLELKQMAWVLQLFRQ